MIVHKYALPLPLTCTFHHSKTSYITILGDIHTKDIRNKHIHTNQIHNKQFATMQSVDLATAVNMMAPYARDKMPAPSKQKGITSANFFQHIKPKRAARRPKFGPLTREATAMAEERLRLKIQKEEGGSCIEYDQDAKIKALRRRIARREALKFKSPPQPPSAPLPSSLDPNAERLRRRLARRKLLHPTPEPSPPPPSSPPHSPKMSKNSKIRCKRAAGLSKVSTETRQLSKRHTNILVRNGNLRSLH
jgi:hypothetical protein